MFGPSIKTPDPSHYKSIVHDYHGMKLLFFPSENDACPNTVIEAIACGVPVCYHPSGGTPEIVKNCGLPLDRFDEMMERLPEFRENCLKLRLELDFEKTAEAYLDL